MTAQTDITPADVVAAMVHDLLPLPSCLGKTECEWAVAAICKVLSAKGLGWDDPVALDDLRRFTLDGTESDDWVRTYIACATRYGWVCVATVKSYYLTDKALDALATYPPVLSVCASRLAKESG